MSVPIEKISAPDPESFLAKYLAGAGKPVIVTDAISSWPARSTWDFDFFASRYAGDAVSVRAIPDNRCIRVTRLGDFINYCEEPSKSFRGFWLEPETGFPLESPPVPPQSPLYLAWNVFPKHPELLDDVHLSPAFIEDWLPLLSKEMRSAMDQETRYFAAGIMMGPAGATSRLHYDFLHSHAYLAQIVGRKRCILFSPEDSDKVYGGRVDPLNPDYDAFPLFRGVTAYECVLEPGEVIFMPSMWWHHVVSLEKSITVNYNFFNRTNFKQYWGDLIPCLPQREEAWRMPPELRAEVEHSS